MKDLGPWRRVAAACGLAASFAASASSTVMAQTTKLRVSIIPIVDVAPLYAAVEQGYFKEVGLAIDTTPVTGGAAGIPGAVAGAYDIVYTNIVSALLARNQGLDIRVIASGSPSGTVPPDTAGLIKRQGEPIASGRDLEGRTVAVNQRNNINWLFAAAWVKATGGDPTKVNYREVPFPQMVDAVKIKQVDAAHAVDPFLSSAIRDPALEVLGWPFSSVAPGIRAAQWVVTGEAVEKQRDALQKFVRAMRKGADWLNANNGKEPFYNLVAGYTRLDPARVRAMNIREISTEIDLPAMRRLAALMREHALIDREIDPAPMIFETPR
jgi:NitT/TauT family transport system substrate-binding protein